MSVAYRYIEPLRLDATLRGQFRLHRLSYYRKIEVPEDRRDELENAVVASVDSWQIEKPGTSDIAALKQLGIHIEHGCNVSNLKFDNFVMQREGRDYFVLCLTSEKNNLLKTDGRLCAVEISSVETLANSLHRAHSNMLGPPMFGKVQYGDRRYDPRTARLDPDPFKKEARFAHEKELRIIWPCQTGAPKFLDTKCPAAGILLKQAT